jgi:hypothetical protein
MEIEKNERAETPVQVASELNDRLGVGVLDLFGRHEENPGGTLRHIYEDGAHFHVISWDTLGRHCSEPNCEVNEHRKDA